MGFYKGSIRVPWGFYKGSIHGFHRVCCRVEEFKV